MKTRREALKMAAAAVAAPAARGQHAHGGSELLPAPGPYTPKVFKAGQMEWVAKIVNLIIPRTDTLGASDAGVPVFIDRALSRDAQAKIRFLAGMKELDESCQRKFGAGFAALSIERQTEMLESISGGKFFKQVKDLTIDGYYTSKAGLTGELGWNANTFLSEFKGCTHPEHQGMTMQIQRSAPVHDVVIIGSGASGGMAAWNLTRKGMRVLMLDAGVKFDRASFWSHVKPWEASEREARGQHAPRFYVDVKEQPYTTLKDQPFDLVRVWGRGGKPNVWGRVSLRYSDLDFTSAARDGWEIPWPIRYKDIAPYYDQVDQLIGVCGGDDDQDSLPGSRFHLPPPPPRCGERLLQKAAKRIGISIVSGRRAVLTEPHNGHPACHYCGACGKGCDVGAFFNSSDYLIEPALATGKLDVVNNAVGARVLVDDKGRASGVQYFDRITKEERRVRARVLVMAASTIDSTRILLNSKSSAYPNGIGNSSGVIGRYLTEQIRFHMYGFMPELAGGKAQNDDGIGGEHIYMPRFNHRDGTKRDYLRGFGMQFWGCGAGANANFAKEIPGFGAEFKNAVKRRYPALVALHPYGEVLPRADNRVTVEGTPLDRYGVPIARIEYKIGNNERRMASEMYDTAESILLAAKAEIVPFEPGALDVAGSAIHEHGTCRMGDDPKRSALNGFCQSHDTPNLFVVDGSAFTTATEKNPTLTILALAWRATDYLAEEMKASRL